MDWGGPLQSSLLVWVTHADSFNPVMQSAVGLESDSYAARHGEGRIGIPGAVRRHPYAKRRGVKVVLTKLVRYVRLRLKQERERGRQGIISQKRVFWQRRRLPFRSPPVQAQGRLWTVATTIQDDTSECSEELLDIALASIAEARRLTLDSLISRARTPFQVECIQQWPGEHYRFLAGMVSALKPTTVVEVGTFEGIGTLSLAEAPRVVTYDVIPWNEIPNSLFEPEDFRGGIQQRLGDLSNRDFFESQRETLADADLIFLDGPKDGHFEPMLLSSLVPLLRETGALLVMDDIRFLNMLQCWRSLSLPKLEVSSFAHWSGTGIASSRGSGTQKK